MKTSRAASSTSRSGTPKLRNSLHEAEVDREQLLQPARRAPATRRLDAAWSFSGSTDYSGVVTSKDRTVTLPPVEAVA